MSGHLEEIICPGCYSVETAEIKHTKPFWTRVHECKTCGHTITESDWRPLGKTTTKQDHELAGRMIAMLKEHGYGYDEMIPVIIMAKEKFKILKRNQNK